MEFRILGPLEVHADGQSVRLGEGRQRALLARLLLQANQVVPTDRLIDELWDEDPAPTAPKMLQKYVSQLRTALENRTADGAGQRIVTRPQGYLLRVDPGELDAARFEQLLAEGRRARAAGLPEAADILAQALALWRGQALEEFHDLPFVRADIARLEEMHLAALEERIGADLDLGRHAAVIGELERLVAAQPLRERLRGQLMLALIAPTGRRRRCASTGTPTACSARSWVSIRRPSSSDSSTPSSTTTRRSTGRRRPR